ncbi:hypothetical protein [Tenacibaculum sp. 190524A02b]|uniref:Bacteriocin-type signal sequence-containing protein n=1 Tax=Tenacibaculum vairaonense TaxID=3137860 RepID=A0ABM9PMD0_9FLAO
MKKLKDLKGMKVLSRKEQNEVNGGFRTYCGGPRKCCVRISTGVEFCDYGYCMGNGQCVWA